MKKKFRAIIIAGVIVAIVSVLIYFVSQDIAKSHDEGFKWLTSGPFSVQEYQHRLGENVYVVAYGIAPNEKGTIRVFTPKNIDYVDWQFDGSAKPSFNVYFRPHTFTIKNKCSVEDFVGVWTMKFDGVSYPPIQFEFINEYIEGAEITFKNMCKETT